MSQNTYSVVLLPGDGIGVEVAEQAQRILASVTKHLSVKFDIQHIPCGGQYFLEHGRDWPEGSEAACKAADLILLGAVGWPSPTGNGPVTMPDGKMAGWSAVIGNRLNLDLYANVRPVKLYEGVKQRICGELKQVWSAGQVDMVFLRENTEGLYAGMGGTLSPGGQAVVATDTRVITRHATERIVRMAFEIAKKRNGAPKDGKRRVTCIVKNNVLDGCRLFAKIFQEIGEEYPDIEKDVAIIDAFTQWLINQPDHYDVCVTSNMFGDIVTDLASVLQGGMGMAVGCNVGDEHGMFEPIHGSAPSHEPNMANPIAMIHATAEGLKWLGDKKNEPGLVAAGEKIELAVCEVLKEQKTLTYDLIGDESASTMSDVTSAIISAFESMV